MKKTFLLYCLLTFATSAFAQKSTDIWEAVTDAPDIRIAKIFNESSSTAGVLCIPSSKICSAYIGADFTCTEKARYPLLVNATTGANLLTTTCVIFNKIPYLLFDDVDLEVVINAFESGSEVGFAMPMQSGQFKVMRFSSAGATAAIRIARTIPADKGSTKDRSL